MNTHFKKNKNIIFLQNKYCYFPYFPISFSFSFQLIYIKEYKSNIFLAIFFYNFGKQVYKYENVKNIAFIISKIMFFIIYILSSIHSNYSLNKSSILLTILKYILKYVRLRHNIPQKNQNYI